MTQDQSNLNSISFRVKNSSTENKMVHLFDPDFNNDPHISIECPELEPPYLSKKKYNTKLGEIFKESIGGYVIANTYIQCIRGSASGVFEPINIVYPNNSGILPITLIPFLGPYQYQTASLDHKSFFLIIKGAKIVVKLLPNSELYFHFRIHHIIGAIGEEDVVKRYNNFIEEQKNLETLQQEQQSDLLNDINLKLDTAIKLLKDISTSVFK